MLTKRLFNRCLYKYNNNNCLRNVYNLKRSFHQTCIFRNNDTMNVSVNGKEVTVPKGCTVLQACEYADIDIPRFCYHDRLSIAGNCRMCLVEVEKSPKPVASCAMPAMPGMVIRTDTELVHKAREGVMEFLLANHPLDCPICDQGGECDLQDQSMVFGSDRSRFKEFKRSVEDKNLGPFVKTTMTRCIHCTRCVRFATEIAGVPTLGATGRGNAMEIGTYVEKVMDSEISGNLVDLCPVGALTSKPFAFTARPWELHHTESIDVLDAVGANIRVDSRGKHVMRIQPRLHEDVNEEWLSDRSRYSYDGLERQRLDEPMIRNNNGKFEKASWGEAFNVIAENMNKIDGKQIKAIAGDLVDVESMVALKDLINRLGSTNHSCTTYDVELNADVRDYRFNSTIAGIEESDLIVLVNTNPRMEAPLINTRIRKAVVNYGTKVAMIGPNCNMTYPFEYLGDSSKTLLDVANGKHKFSEQIKNAENPMIIVGFGALNGENGSVVTNTLQRFQNTYHNLRNDDWNGFNILHLNASQVGALDIGFVPGPDASNDNVKLVYLLGSENVDQIPKDAFVIYQGHHGDAGAHRANVILPGLAYTEKEATYVNMEGRPQHAHAAVGSLGNAKNDWEIIRALSEFLKCPLPYDNLSDIRRRMADIAPHLVRVDTVETPTVSFGHPEVINSNSNNKKTKTSSDSFVPLLNNHFLTNVISRCSKNMANASKQLPASRNNYS